VTWYIYFLIKAFYFISSIDYTIVACKPSLQLIYLSSLLIESLAVLFLSVDIVFVGSVKS
jgi:hypothetical protein